jgi:hypothetical protein
MKLRTLITKLSTIIRNLAGSAGSHFKLNFKGIVVITICTLLFFAPILGQLGTYSEGGDAMFNAWTLSRNHHCLLNIGCDKYSDANIFFPNKNTFLYSETQLSAGVLTLPLFLIDSNPIFANNVWTILSFLFAGYFMYLLASKISGNKGIIPIVSGLIFEFAPHRMSEIWHLQNLSIFYLPLALLLCIKYLESNQRRFLFGLYITLVLQFFASWYQMAFVVILFTTYLIFTGVLRLHKIKKLIICGIILLLAVLTTLPLVKQYTTFSKTNSKSFSIRDQAIYSSSLADYLIPNNGTLIGKAYYKFRPTAQVNSYNPDSYSYHGIVLYALFILTLAWTFIKTNKTKTRIKKELIVFIIIAFVGLVVSLGPLLKLKSSYIYQEASSAVQVAVPLPWFAVVKILPQLSFMRALGRSSVLVLFSLCTTLAYLPIVLQSCFKRRSRNIIKTVVVALVLIELMPLHMVPMNNKPYAHNLTIPEVYKYIKYEKRVNNFIILSGDFDYPGAGIPVAIPEQVLWSGYHTKNIFNGYSGFNPENYWEDYYNYLDFNQDDVVNLKSKNINFVLVDRLLSTQKPELDDKVHSLSSEQIYKDDRYSLYEL